MCPDAMYKLGRYLTQPQSSPRFRPSSARHPTPRSARIDWGVTHKLALRTVRNELEDVIQHRERKADIAGTIDLAKIVRRLDVTTVDGIIAGWDSFSSLRRMRHLK